MLDERQTMCYGIDILPAQLQLSLLWEKLQLSKRLTVNVRVWCQSLKFNKQSFLSTLRFLHLHSHKKKTIRRGRWGMLRKMYKQIQIFEICITKSIMCVISDCVFRHSVTVLIYRRCMQLINYNIMLLQKQKCVLYPTETEVTFICFPERNLPKECKCSTYCIWMLK